MKFATDIIIAKMALPSNSALINRSKIICLARYYTDNLLYSPYIISCILTLLGRFIDIYNSCFTNFRVCVLQIWVQSAFYKFESNPRFTNLSPVRVLQIWVQSAFYKFESSLRFTSPVQSALYNMPSFMMRLDNVHIINACCHNKIRTSFKGFLEFELKSCCFF